MNLEKGLKLSVYRPSEKPQTNGVTADHDHLVVVGVKSHDGPIRPLVPFDQPFTASDEAPAVILAESSRPSRFGPTLIPLEYLDPDTGNQKLPKGYFALMPGGNYAGVDDSRWGELTDEVNGGPLLRLVPVYDNLLTVEEYLAEQESMKELIRKTSEAKKDFGEQN